MPMVSMSQVLKRHETFTQNFCQLIFETAVSDCARKLRADSFAPTSVFRPHGPTS